MSTIQQARLRRDLNSVADQVDTLLARLGDQGSDRLQAMRDRVSDLTSGLASSARDRLGDLPSSMKTGATRAARFTDDYVHENPWRVIGVGAAIGLLLGYLVSRRY